jgi:signal transduction histidine kinase
MRRKRRTVWIVDDSRAEAERARTALADTYDTLVLADGAEAVERLGAQDPPDVMVLDWIMPGMTGVEVCRFVRSAPGPASQIGILLLTSHRASERVVEGLGAGANDYLTKPFADEELRARVGSLIRSREVLEQVEDARESVGQLLAQVPDALVVLDAHGRLTYANAEAEQMLRQPAAALVGRPLSELIPELQLHRLAVEPGALTALPDVMIGEDVYAPRIRYNPSDFATSTTISLRNVTARRQTEAKRLDFYSIIAHDLRSPLSAMLLRTDLILRGARGILPAELIVDIRKIEGNVRSMVGLINDFLDLARLEGGGYRLDREAIDAGTLLTATIEDIRPLIEESKLTIDVEIGPGELDLMGDRHRLIQVLTNLLSNAIKFTRPGGRILAAARRRGGEIELRVSDTGRGIPADLIPVLFQRYQRAPGRASVGGTGLGLMIVREIVEAHGGQVDVSSVEGVGSTFTLRLPSLAREAPHRVRRDEVLVVDDEPEIRESLQLLLEAAGYTVHTACNGREALEVLTEGLEPRMVILDVSMPVMTGPQLLEAMRGDARLARVPVCVMSGDLTALRAAPAGALVMQKPIQVDRLLEFLARVARNRAVAVR